MYWSLDDIPMLNPTQEPLPALVPLRQNFIKIGRRVGKKESEEREIRARNG